jgi:hypothetical protein
MEISKKIGKNSRAKHLRKNKGKWTKRMANSKSRLAAKKNLKTGS